MMMMMMMWCNRWLVLIHIHTHTRARVRAKKSSPFHVPVVEALQQLMQPGVPTVIQHLDLCASVYSDVYSSGVHTGWAPIMPHSSSNAHNNTNSHKTQTQDKGAYNWVQQQLSKVVHIVTQQCS